MNSEIIMEKNCLGSKLMMLSNYYVTGVFMYISKIITISHLSMAPITRIETQVLSIIYKFPLDLDLRLH